MPNLAATLRQEITRLARKEAKYQTDTMRKLSAQYRRDIAQLKRQVSDLSKQLDFLKQQERKRAAQGVPEAVAEGRRFSARGLKTHREKLGLSAADYGTLVGVTGQTVYSWEQGRSKPRDAQLAALIGVRQLGKREAAKRLELLEG